MNKIKKAIEILNDSESDMEYSREEIRQAHLLAISLLEKRIPKKIEKDTVMDETYSGECFEREISTCPSCNNIYLSLNQPYCNQCGQRLEWRG